MLVAVNTTHFAQDTNHVNNKRLWVAIGGGTAGYVGSIVALNEVWYKDQERTSFHFFNDNTEWLQVDKYGHALTAYEIGRAGDAALQWAGVKRNHALWYGGMFGAAYLTTFELLDGRAADWGFSWGDALSNFGGTGLYIGQELLWKEQRIRPKFSVHFTHFADIRPQVLGSTTTERLLKDYNGQTYWLSVNVASFLNEDTRIPAWLNVAVGFGGEEMLVGDKNTYVTCKGNDCNTYKQYRQYYLSFDIDLWRLNIRSKFLKGLANTFGFIKVPLPAIEFSSEGIKGHWLYF